MMSVHIIEGSNTQSASKTEEQNESQQQNDETGNGSLGNGRKNDAIPCLALFPTLTIAHKKDKPYLSSASIESLGASSRNITESSSSSMKRSNSWPCGKRVSKRSTSECGTSVYTSASVPESSDHTANSSDGYSFADEIWDGETITDANHDDIQAILNDFKEYAEREAYPGKWLEFIGEFLMPLSEPLVYYVLGSTNRIPIRFHSCHRKIKDENDYWSLVFKRKATLHLQLPYSHGLWDPISECVVCYRYLGGLTRLCCNQLICESCLNNYFVRKVEDEGRVQICCPACPQLCERAEISFHLPPPTKDKFYRFLVDANNDPKRKTCPKCSHITECPKESRTRKEKKYGVRVTCPECNLQWCFSCQAPSHTMSCAKYRKGDLLLRLWTKQLIDGQADNRNARKCPGCSVFIQRSEGCNHMQCSHCGKRFCYACGCSMRSVLIIGSHNVRLSVLGCSQSFLPTRPHLRRFIRGSVLSLGIAVSPVVFVGACVVGLGVGSFFGGRFVVRKVKRRIGRRGQTQTRQTNRNRETIVYDGLNLDPYYFEQVEESIVNWSHTESDEEESEASYDMPTKQRTSSCEYITRL